MKASDRHSTGGGRTVLYIDTAYTFREVREKKHESFLRAREASGVFAKVWSVHPLADLVGSRTRSIDLFRLGPNHLVIEGKAQLLPLPKWCLPVNFLFSQWRLYRFLSRLMQRHDISMVMAADPFYSSLLGLALARRHGKPFGIRIGGNADEIYEATGVLAMPRLLPSYRLQRIVQRFVLKRADLVSGINRNNLEFGLKNGARKHTAVIPISSNVAEIHRTPPEQRRGIDRVLQRLSISAGGAILLYLGRLLELKHPDDALRAMAFAIKRKPGTIGLFVGLGPMEPQLRDLAMELGVAEWIRFLGQLDQETLSLLIPHCIMLSPSAGQMAVLECGLGGAPIVAYDRDFQSEFIHDGRNGFLVPFRDWQAMGERADRLIADPELKRRLSIAVRAAALREVDPERVRRMEWEAFGKVLPLEKSGRCGIAPA